MKYRYRTIRAPMGAWQIQDIETGKIVATRATRKEIREAMIELGFSVAKRTAEEAHERPAT